VLLNKEADKSLFTFTPQQHFLLVLQKTHHEKVHKEIVDSKDFKTKLVDTVNSILKKDNPEHIKVVIARNKRFWKKHDKGEHF